MQNAFHLNIFIKNKELWIMGSKISVILTKAMCQISIISGNKHYKTGGTELGNKRGRVTIV